MSYGFVQTGSDKGIQGAVATGQGTRGVVIFLETDDVQGTLDRAVAAGAESWCRSAASGGRAARPPPSSATRGNWIGLAKDVRAPTATGRRS